MSENPDDFGGPSKKKSTSSRTRGGGRARISRPAAAAESDLQVNLSKHVQRGLGWSFANNIVTRIATLVTGIITARILFPEDFGFFAVAQTVLMAGLSMNELGVSLAIVRWPDPISRIAPTVTSMSLAWSVVVFTTIELTAPTIARLANMEGATPFIRMLAVCILLNGATCVPAALLTRQFLQRRRTFIDLTALAVAASTQVGLAVSGFGATALVAGLIGANAVTSILVWLLSPARYWPGFDARVAQELLGFGLPLAASSLMVFAVLNLDYLIVGRTLGAERLGFYLLAFNLSSWPVTLISSSVRRISLPAFSRLSHDADRSAREFERAWSMLLRVAALLCAGLAAFSTPIITTLYGERWAPAAEALAWLCVVGCVRVCLELAYDYLVARGEAKLNFLLHALWIAALIPALIVGAQQDSIRGAAIGHAVAGIGVALPTTLASLAHLQVNFLTLGRLSFPAILGAGFLFVASRIVTTLVDNIFVQLLVGVLLGLLLLLWLVPEVRTVFEHLRSRTRPRS